MLRLYLRIAAAILVAAVACYLALSWLLDPGPEVRAQRILGYHATQEAEALASTPPAERRSAVRRLRERLNYGVAIEPYDGGRELRGERRADAIFVVARVPGEPGQLVFGPIPGGSPGRFPVAVVLERHADRDAEPG